MVEGAAIEVCIVVLTSPCEYIARHSTVHVGRHTSQADQISSSAFPVLITDMRA